jgi:hypothetical protein
MFYTHVQISINTCSIKQGVLHGQFQMLDYGSPESNQKHYNQVSWLLISGIKDALQLILRAFMLPQKSGENTVAVTWMCVLYPSVRPSSYLLNLWLEIHVDNKCSSRQGPRPWPLKVILESWRSVKASHYLNTWRLYISSEID